jgi:hypothetical protein
MYWHFHLIRMNLRARMRHQAPLTALEKKDILDFLEYDSQVRKVQDRKRFDEQTEELKRGFEPILKGLLEQMRENPEAGPAANP